MLSLIVPDIVILAYCTLFACFVFSLLVCVLFCDLSPDDDEAEKDHVSKPSSPSDNAGTTLPFDLPLESPSSTDEEGVIEVSAVPLEVSAHESSQIDISLLEDVDVVLPPPSRVGWNHRVTGLVSDLLDVHFFDDVTELIPQSSHTDYFLCNELLLPLPILPDRPKDPADLNISRHAELELPTYCSRFAYRFFVTPLYDRIVGVTHFGPQTLGPRTTHGGALVSMALEAMRSFVRAVPGHDECHGGLRALDVTYLTTAPLECDYQLRAHAAAPRSKDGEIVFPVQSAIIPFSTDAANVKTTKKSLVVAFGDFGCTSRPHDTNSVGLLSDPSWRSQVSELAKGLVREGYVLVPPEKYRPLHGPLMSPDHFLLFDQYSYENVRAPTSSYFNFRIFVNRRDARGVCFVFFGPKTAVAPEVEGEEGSDAVHDGAVVSMFDALGGLTSCLLDSRGDLYTSSLSVKFVGPTLRINKVYRMEFEVAMLKRERTKSGPARMREKQRIDGSVSDLDESSLFAEFQGFFVHQFEEERVM